MMVDFTVADVLAWARTKPADEVYDFCDSDNCAIAQFGKETGRRNLLGLDSCQLRKIDPDLVEALAGFDDIITWTRTFGGLVARLEAITPEPVSDTWTKADAYLTDIEAVEA